MKRNLFFMTVVILTLTTAPAVSMQEHSGHGSSKQHDHTQMQHGNGEAMDHAAMGGTYKHTASQGGIDAAFQVMSLASMNMTSEEGDTHHIMVDLKTAGDGMPIKNAVGKIKVIAPDKSEQVSPLKNYSGILAGNFTFTQPGKYGVICLLKVGDEKQVFKFWYPHM